MTTNSILNNYQYSSNQVHEIITAYPDLRCLTGHKLSLDLPFDKSDFEIIPFTWIRNPVERFISHYFFHRNQTDFVPEAKRLNLSDYITWALEEGHQSMYINGQVQFLSGGEIDIITNAMSEHNLLLFPLEDLDASILTLVKRFPEDFLPVRPNIKNMSTKDQSVTQKDYDRIRSFVELDLQLLMIARDTVFSKNGANEYPDRKMLHTPLRKKIIRHTSKLVRSMADRIDKLC